MPKFLPVFFLLFIGGLFPVDALGQSGFLFHVEDPIYLAIGQLQNRGLLLDLNPTALPYSESEVLRALERIDRSQLDRTEAARVAEIERRFTTKAMRSDLATVGLRFFPGVRMSNNSRLDPLRYLREGDDHVFDYAALQLRFAVGRFASALAIRHDLFYDRDPDGLDSALRWRSRTEDSYLRYDGHIFGFELGRFSRHWGLSGQAAPLVSSNPRSYDQIGFRIGGDRLSVRALLGELDSITADGRFTGVAGDDSVAVGSERRYLAVHRLDWRPNSHTQIYFLQSTLYSGSNAGLSLKYLNPFHSVIFALDSVPKNEENNGFVGMGVWYQSGTTTLHFQGIVDDVDVLNLSEPMSFVLTGSATFARLSANLDVRVGGEAVASRAYNTAQAEGRYLYLLRGLGTQFSDYVSLFAQADFSAVNWIPELTISPRVDLLLQGEGDIRNPFPGNDSDADAILTGTVERTIRGALRIMYEPEPWVFLRVDAGINSLSNAGNIEGASAAKFLALLEVGFRFSIDHSFSLDFTR